MIMKVVLSYNFWFIKLGNYAPVKKNGLKSLSIEVLKMEQLSTVN